MADLHTPEKKRRVAACPVFAQPVKGRYSKERFHDALRSLMDERHLSYRQLAYKTQLSAGYLNHLTKGSRPVPADPVLQTLAAALRVEPAFFLEYRLRQMVCVLDEAPSLADKLYGVLVCEETLTDEAVAVLRNPLQWGRVSRDGQSADQLGVVGL
jgi:transcriptional regulator with XRE-family HTH domain